VKAGHADKYGGNHTCQSFFAAGKRPFANIQACKWLLWCSLVHSADEDVQVTVEQQALEDYLLSEPPLKAAASQLLSVRAASPDIVTQVLTQLSSKPPQELWSLIHADAAAAGKPAKAAPAKAPAAVKGKAGEFNHLILTIITIIIIVIFVVIIINSNNEIMLLLLLLLSLLLLLLLLLCHHIHGPEACCLPPGANCVTYCMSANIVLAWTQLTIRRVVVCHEKIRCEINRRLMSYIICYRI